VTNPDNPDPPPETPTPGDIEAALSDLRAQLSAPAAPAPPEPEPAALAEPRSSGRAGTAALLLVAALLGGGVATVIPGVLGMAQGGEDDDRRRIEALESRLGQIATGQSDAVATQTFADLKANLGGLDVRLRALEQASVAAPANGDGGTEIAAAQVALNALAERVAGLERRLTEVGQQTPQAPPAPSPEVASEIAALKAALGDVAARLGTLERVAPAGDLIASIDGRVSALEAADPGRASRQAALALIVARLSGTAASGRPYAAELAALKSAAPAVDVTAFAPYADKGLPTVARLAEQLNAIDGAVRDGADFDRGGDWFDRVWRGFGRLITVHEDGLADGREPEDHLARAQYHAGRGDLSNARAEMDQLTGAARGAAAMWLADAGARLALDTALDELTAKILSDLARPAP
jgi:hypothetical protein